MTDLDSSDALSSDREAITAAMMAATLRLFRDPKAVVSAALALLESPPGALEQAVTGTGSADGGRAIQLTATAVLRRAD